MPRAVLVTSFILARVGGWPRRHEVEREEAHLDLWDAFNEVQRASTSTENVVRFLVRSRSPPEPVRVPSAIVTAYVERRTRISAR